MHTTSTLTRGGISAIVLLALSLLPACTLFAGDGEGQGTTESPVTATAEPAMIQPTPTSGPEMMTIYSLEDGEIQVPVPPPYTYGDLLSQNVEQGVWEYGEGLVLLLRSMSGELNAEVMDGFVQVEETNTTGLLRLASDYLQGPDRDPEYAEEVERLLGLLAPTQEYLDSLSRPRAAASRDGLFLTGYDRQTEIPAECANIVEEGFSASVDTGQFCYVYIEMTEQQNRLRVYYPKWWEDDPERIEWVDAAMTGLFDSSPVYSDLGRFDDVNVVFSISQPSDSATTLAYQTFFPADEACPVVALPLVYGDGLDQFKQTIAHEAFHCFQDWNLTTSPYSAHIWWAEGSAEYFSNVVYPTINDEQNRTESYYANSIHRPWFDLSYLNFLLFQYLGNELGDAQVIQLLETISASGGIAAQASTLTAYPNMDSLFLEFVVATTSTGVMDTGGGMIIEHPAPLRGLETIGQEGDTQFLIEPFVAGRFGVSYGEGKRFLETFEENESVRHSMAIEDRLQDPGAWSSLPVEVRSRCNDDEKYVLVLTSVDGPGDFKANVSLMEEAECDSCVLGTWDIETISYANYYERLFAAQGQPVELFVDGHFYFEFNEDGEFLTRRHDLEISTSIADQPSIVTTIDGQGQGEYSADGEILTIRGFSSVTNNVSIRIEGVEVPGGLGSSVASFKLFDDSPGGLPGETQPNHSGSYTCSNELLSIEFPQYGDVSFLRVEDIVPTLVPTPGN